ncbi:MAG: hypothetical protein HY270_13215 [Deltaproteobacteria bacterium]|nr:hypothetical protein [Deltaproteobacteria bacterium]
MKAVSRKLNTSVVGGIAVLFAAVLVSRAQIALAGRNVWTSHGPGTTGIKALIVDPSATERLYAATAVGVTKSIDAGATWNTVSTGLTNLHVNVIAVDPCTSDTLYAGTDGGGLFKSTNGGSSWSSTATGLYDYVEAVAIDPTACRTLYVATAAGGDVAGLFKSSNGGESWELSSTGLPGSTFVTAIAIDPKTPRIVYVTTVNAAVFVSTDAGKTWSSANVGLPEVGGTALAVDPTVTGTLYFGFAYSNFCCVGGAVFKSADGGGSWSTALDLTNKGGVMAVVVDPITPGLLYAGTQYAGNVYKSTDGGVSWSPHQVAPYITAVSIDPTAPATLYVGTNDGPGSPLGKGGIFKSIDSASTWVSASSGLPGALNISAMAFDRTTPGTLYGGTSDAGVFKSSDAGLTWRPANTGLPFDNGANNISALALDSTPPSILYAGTSAGVFRSTNGGDNWRSTISGLTSTLVRNLIIDPTAPGTLYAWTSNGVSKSTNSAGTWKPASTGLPSDLADIYSPVALVVDPTKHGTLYAGMTRCTDVCRGSVFKSSDGGGVWTDISTGQIEINSLATLTIDPAAPTTLYVSGLGDDVVSRFYKSTDGGQTWSTVDSDLPLMPYTAFSALAVDPTTSGTLYAGVGGSVFTSTDGGNVWRALDTGLSSRVTLLAIDPDAPQRVYAGTLTGGVFDIEQGSPPCVGDCNGDNSATVDELITLVNIALGNAPSSGCTQGVTEGAEVDVTLVIQAVNNALNGCSSSH